MTMFRPPQLPSDRLITEQLKMKGLEEHLSIMPYDGIVVDYKNVVTKPADNAPIPFDYKIQLLAYAYILRQLGYEINRIRIVYGIRPTKTLPARCVVVTESIDFIADKLISDTLQLIAESVLMVKENPSLAYLIFKSMDFKE